MIWLHVSTNHLNGCLPPKCGDSHIFLSILTIQQTGGITVQDEKEIKAGQEQTEEQRFWNDVKYEEEKSASDR